MLYLHTMNKEKKIRKQLTITKKAFDCATKSASNTNRSFNNYIETLILNDCAQYQEWYGKHNPNL